VSYSLAVSESEQGEVMAVTVSAGRTPLQI
jgi:hypothetical protein